MGLLRAADRVRRRIGAVTALIIGLSVYQAAFISEVYRSGIQACRKGHREAAQVLGLTPVQSFRRIVLPQAIRMTLPPLASNFVQLIKFSSLGAVISVSEITRRGMELVATNFRPLEIFTFIAVVYFFICWPLAMAHPLVGTPPAEPLSHGRLRVRDELASRVDAACDRLIAATQAAGAPSPRPIRRATPRTSPPSPKRCCSRSPASRSSASSPQPRVVSLVGRMQRQHGPAAA